MNEEVQMIFEMTKERMEKSIEHLDNELMRIRAGKANVHILDGIMVDYYGSPTPLAQVSNISTPDAKTIMIQPWEKTMIEPIEKALMNSNVGITPANNGEVIRLGIPQLTEERRRDLVKQVKNEGENARGIHPQTGRHLRCEHQGGPRRAGVAAQREDHLGP